MPLLTLTPGTRLGRYEILSAIGAGGMGEVYRAHDPTLDRQVAIKLLPPETAADPSARQRLRREAMAVAAIDHPYICKIFEIGEHDAALFLVMEYVPGDTLDHRLQSGRLPAPEALRLGGEIAEALEEAHARRFLHRDLKPANIMVTPSGHVKVMDFGLARRVEDTPTTDQATGEFPASRLTAAGMIVGTPDYMSPEQVKGLELDSRSDLFSFGVILAEMLGGRHPFRQPSVGETLSAVLREPPDFADDMPQHLKAVVSRLLAKNPDDRHTSAAEVRADLTRLAASSDTIAIAPVVRRVSIVRTRAAWAALAIALTLVGYLVAKGRHRSPAPKAPEAQALIKSIAVLPLDNYSGDPSQDYFAEGMTDELTAKLASISQLRVISRGSVMQFRRKDRPPAPEIAAKLNVDAFIEGSVSRDGEKVHITAQLIDARADKHMWAKTFDGSSRDVLALQTELASAIAREVNVRLTPSEQSRLAARSSLDPAAHDAYLRGRYFFNRPSDDNPAIFSFGRPKPAQERRKPALARSLGEAASLTTDADTLASALCLHYARHLRFGSAEGAVEPTIYQPARRQFPSASQRGILAASDRGSCAGWIAWGLTTTLAKALAFLFSAWAASRSPIAPTVKWPARSIRVTGSPRAHVSSIRASRSQKVAVSTGSASLTRSPAGFMSPKKISITARSAWPHGMAMISTVAIQLMAKSSTCTEFRPRIQRCRCPLMSG